MQPIILIDDSSVEEKLLRIFFLLVNEKDNHEENPVEDQEKVNLSHFSNFVRTVGKFGKKYVYNRTEWANCSQGGRDVRVSIQIRKFVRLRVQLWEQWLNK